MKHYGEGGVDILKTLVLLTCFLLNAYIVLLCDGIGASPCDKNYVTVQFQPWKIVNLKELLFI